MKKLLKTNLLAVTILFSISAIGQIGNNPKPVRPELYSIYICKDAMDDKEYAYGSKKLICIDEKVNKDVAFSVSISWEYIDGTAKYAGLIVTSAGIGTCMEDDELIILMEDDSKVKLKSWNKFNCKGNSYFDLYHKEFDSFNNKKVKAIRLTNGRSMENFTYKLKPEESTFFMNAREAMNMKQYKKGKCDE